MAYKIYTKKSPEIETKGCPILRTYKLFDDMIKIAEDLSDDPCSGVWLKYVRAMELMAQHPDPGYNPEFTVVNKENGGCVAYLDGVELEEWRPPVVQKALRSKEASVEVSAEDTWIDGGLERIAVGD